MSENYMHFNTIDDFLYLLWLSFMNIFHQIIIIVERSEHKTKYVKNVENFSPQNELAEAIILKIIIN
jgi:hypothetical protein